MKGFFAVLVLYSCTLFGGETIKAPSTNLQFPTEIYIQNSAGQKDVLHATGVATRSKFFVNVYSIAHYMSNPKGGSRNALFDEILTDNQAKQVTLRWVRDVELGQMRDGLKESMDKILLNEPAKIDKETEQFLSFFKESIQSGDEHVIRWLPGGVVEVEVNGEHKGTINNPEFAHTLWSVWFGPKSVVSRNRLVALIKTK